MSVVDLTVEPFDTVTLLAGGRRLTDRPCQPYDDETCDFLAAVSARLMKDPAARSFPDVISFAYWCRRSNLKSLAAQADGGRFPLSTRLGRGIVFHVAPSNIPVNFAFSFVFGLLSGNTNIVRVPSKPFAQTDLICRAISAVLEDFPGLSSRMALISYPSSGPVTPALCAVSDARVIWGGDATVESIRAFPARPRCKDISFSDRYSVAIIRGRAIAEASDTDLAELADRFYNDTYLMDQNACSSPQMIFWEDASDETRARFWDAVEGAARRRYLLQPAVVMDKYVQLCEDAIDGRLTGPVDFDGLLSVVPTADLPADISRYRGKGGYFYEHAVSSPEEIAPFVTERYQTLLYHGYEPEELRHAVVTAGLRGIDRIVPIGAAMDIDVFWDGYDLVAELSRIVDAR